MGKVGGLQMLSALRHIGLAQTCHNDIIDKTREWWNTANEESNSCTPICRISRRIAVDTVEVVHVGY